MQTIELGKTGTRVSRLVYGCMRLAGDGSREARSRGKRAIRTAIDAGYTAFDHADIYGNGECERVFGETLAESPGLRDGLCIIGKCGIRFAGDPSPGAPKRYDFSAAHIVASVEGSLARLGIDRLDALLLHRPDYLCDPEEVAGCLDALQSDGKVAHVGVSNFTPSQVALLSSASSSPLVANQVEINLHRVAALEDGTLDQCMRLGMTPQAWSPLAGAVFEAWGNTFTAEDSARLRAELARQADRYGTEDWLVALAWLLRHPARIAPIVGSTTPERIRRAVTALDIDYTREDWYRLLEARNGTEVP
ncbi:MAG: aldo/keto reductase [Woeseiaceae bacterium]|jgi:predicted oxidoreductase|nr:aldo/keto reductase [Woeseiaceae bacterium]